MPSYFLSNISDHQTHEGCGGLGINYMTLHVFIFFSSGHLMNHLTATGTTFSFVEHLSPNSSPVGSRYQLSKL
uniref:Uncharacterized protein n=1 Tax=Arundo donax TaxID=35708 RepID=A0A0A8Y4T6_ARUDO